MKFSIQLILNAIASLTIVDGDKDPILEQLSRAMDAASDALKSMDGLTVKGRDNVDTLLGCMMAIEAIIGEENNGK